VTVLGRLSVRVRSQRAVGANVASLMRERYGAGLRCDQLRLTRWPCPLCAAGEEEWWRYLAGEVTFPYVPLVVPDRCWPCCDACVGPLGAEAYASELVNVLAGAPRRLTLAELYRRTQALDGADRLAVVLALPEVQRRVMWREVAAHVRARTDGLAATEET
jgi:hypothetical protein